MEASASRSGARLARTQHDPDLRERDAQRAHQLHKFAVAHRE
jgi:hypothetical protein